MVTMTTLPWITRTTAGSCFILNPMRFISLAAPILLLVGACNSMVVAPPSSSRPATRTTTPDVLVRVCTGADCRVDGASECLRMMQKLASTTSNNTDKTLLQVKASPCLGPCGDGPNVVILDGTTNKRIVDKELQARKSGSGSVVPADIFGASVTGVYQVRTSQDAALVMDLAIGSLGTSLDDDQDVAQSASSNLVSLENNDNNAVVVITSNRAWYDRPRNERLMLQRLMHVSILAGLASYGTSHDGSELSNLQWGTAALLWIASNFIMKESLLEMVLLKTKKQLRIK